MRKCITWRYLVPCLMTVLFLVVLVMSIWIPLHIRGAQNSSSWEGPMVIGMLSAIFLGAIAGFLWEDALYGDGRGDTEADG